MRSSMLLVLAAGGLLNFGCPRVDVVTGSGKLETREMKVADFSRVEASNAFRVEIRRADKFHVEVTADDNLFDSIRVEREGDTLKIGLEPGKSFNLRGDRLQASIEMPALAGVRLNGACQGSVEGFKSSDAFAGKCTGASSLKGSVDAGHVRLEASGASSINLKGSGKDAELSASGASGLSLGSFALDRADVELSGASHATVDARDSLDYRVSGASTLTYRGDPKVGKSESSGASSVVHR